MQREQLSYCRICAAACGIVVTTDAEVVLRVRGDTDHPVSRGYTCAKGRGLAEWHHRADRLDHPRHYGTRAGWEPVLDDLAGTLRGIVTDHGADAIGLYLATGLAYDSAGQIAAAQWLPSIGSSSFFTAVTVDNAPVLVAADLVTGQPMLNPVWQPERPGLLLLFGTNPVVSHGYGTALPDPIRHLREYRRAGGQVWVLDPRRSETAAAADHHLAVRPGSDVAVLGAIAAALLADGADASELRDHCDTDQVAILRTALASFTPGRAASAAGIDDADVEALIDAVRSHPQRLAVMCGTGVMMAADGVLAEWLRWVVLILTGSLDRDGGMRFNRGAVNRMRTPRVAPPVAPAGPSSRPDLPRVIGQLPVAAMVDEIESGRLRALVVTGGNPLTAFPEPDRLRAALRTLDPLVVIDVTDNELCGLATHVLPATGQLERADITLAELTAVHSGLQATSAVIAPAAARRPVWWMLAALSNRMGSPALGGVDPDHLTDELFLHGVLSRSSFPPAEVFAAGPRGIDVAVEYGWVRETLLVDGQWNIAPDVLVERLADHVPPRAGLVLAPRREMAWSNSVRYAGDGGEPVARVHPDDMHSAGLDAADRATFTGRHGSVTVTLRPDPLVAPGVVSVTHGRTDASPGALTSTRTDVDPITAMPLASGVPITITSPEP